MTNDQFLVLAVPAFAVLAVFMTTAITYYRVTRYGRVFNWPVQSPRAADGRRKP